MTNDIVHYWWLIFPVMFIGSGIIRMILRNNYEQKKLELMKAYLDKGQAVPDSLRRNIDC